MTYKFTKEKKHIEFIEKEDGITIATHKDDLHQYFSIEISEQDLFELIGGLLRIQSKIKKV